MINCRGIACLVTELQYVEAQRQTCGNDFDMNAGFDKSCSMICIIDADVDWSSSDAFKAHRIRVLLTSLLNRRLYLINFKPWKRKKKFAQHSSNPDMENFLWLNSTLDQGSSCTRKLLRFMNAFS